MLQVRFRLSVSRCFGCANAHGRTCTVSLMCAYSTCYTSALACIDICVRLQRTCAVGVFCLLAAPSNALLARTPPQDISLGVSHALTVPQALLERSPASAAPLASTQQIASCACSALLVRSQTVPRLPVRYVKSTLLSSQY